MTSKKPKVHTKVHINFLKKLYSKAAIYEAKKLVDGVKIPCTETGYSWHVYYYFRCPYDDKMKKFIAKKGINNYKTVTERRRAANNLRRAIDSFLQDGYNPFENYVQKETVDKNIFTIAEAFNLAFKEKYKIWGESTRNNNQYLFNVFIRWIEAQKLENRNIEELTKRHISMFLNHLTANNSINSVSRNNYRRLVVLLLEQLISDDILKQNVASTIPKLIEKPEKNKPFTKDQLKAIKEYLLKNDPYLYLYLQFIMYGFFRPIEVVRIKLKDINLERNVITVATKTESSFDTILIVKNLRTIIEKMNIDFSNSEYFLFTNTGKPNIWNVAREKSKEDYFIRKFKKVKTALNLGAEYGTYSFRHTFALDLYHQFIKQGLSNLEAKHKLMTITRHRSIESLERYLRDIGAVLPKDYSSDFTIDF